MRVCAEFVQGWNSIPKYDHEPVSLAARQISECVVSHPMRAVRDERTVPESDKSNKEQIIGWICWSSERKNSRPFHMHLSRLGESHLGAGVLWFSARLVAGVVCVWLSWFLLGRLVLREGVDVEPRTRGQVACYFLVPQLDFPPR